MTLLLCGTLSQLPARSVETTTPSNPCPSLSEIIAKIEQADANRRSSLDDFSAVRHYIFHNERLNKTAEMLVKSEYHKGEGTRFAVLSSEGAEGLSGRVFKHVLEAEKETSIKGQTRISSDNYEFELLGAGTLDGHPCYVLKLTPKQKSKYLLDGTAWVDAKDFGFVRITGRPSASLSFWVGRPTITMDFEKVGAYWLIARNRSHAQGHFAGVSDLTIEYGSYRLNGGASNPTTVAYSNPVE